MSKIAEQKGVLKTGFRLIFILKLLFERDYTKSEIIDKLEETAKIRISPETLKLDLNSLKKAGCNIEISGKRGYRKISLINKELPFVFFNDDDFEVFKMVKNASLDLLGHNEIVFLQKFYKKISKFFDEKYKKISNFAYYDLINLNVLKEIENSIQEKAFGKIIYDSPLGKKNEYIVKPVEITTRNDKVYVDCITQKYGKVTFRTDNIKSFEKAETGFEHPKIYKKTRKKFRYLVKKSYFENNITDKKEKILQENQNSYLIETEEKEKFFVIQRILTLGENCLEIQDKRLKEDVYKNLKLTLENYKKCS